MQLKNRHHIYLDAETSKKLEFLSQKTGQSKSAIVRSLLNQKALREMPPADYFKMTAELHSIGTNINQLARIANSSGNIDKLEYIKFAAELNLCISQIKLAVMAR